MQAERVPQGQQKHMSFSSFTQKLSEIYGCRYDDGDKTFFEIAGAMRNIKIRITEIILVNIFQKNHEFEIKDLFGNSAHRYN